MFLSSEAFQQNCIIYFKCKWWTFWLKDIDKDIIVIKSNVSANSGIIIFVGWWQWYTSLNDFFLFI